MRADLAYVVDGNCSICRRRGALWQPASDADLHILGGEADLARYEFTTKTAKHYFCRHSGIHPFIRPRRDPSSWAVNVRCIDGVDLATMTVLPFDGANWEAAAAALLGRRKAPPET